MRLRSFYSTLVRLLIPDFHTLKSFSRYLEKAERDSKRCLICSYREIFWVTPGLGSPTFFWVNVACLISFGISHAWDLKKYGGIIQTKWKIHLSCSAHTYLVNIFLSHYKTSQEEGSIPFLSQLARITILQFFIRWWALASPGSIQSGNTGSPTCRSPTCRGCFREVQKLWWQHHKRSRETPHVARHTDHEIRHLSTMSRVARM